MKFRTKSIKCIFFIIGQFYSQNLYSRPEVLSTNEGPPTEDDSYLGYSVAVGTFGFSSEPGAAVGMPKGGGLLGKVKSYKNNNVKYVIKIINFAICTGRFILY